MSNKNLSEELEGIIEVCGGCGKEIEVPREIYKEIVGRTEESFVPIQYCGRNRLFLYCQGQFYHDQSCYDA